MAQIPNKQFVDLYQRSQSNPGMWIKGGRSYEMYTYPDGRVKLTHYGTPIYRYDPKTGEYNTGGAYSASDRDAINSMAAITGVGAARIVDGKLSAPGTTPLNFNKKGGKYAARRQRFAFWKNRR
jgi:hypothetical protein